MLIIYLYLIVLVTVVGYQMLNDVDKQYFSRVFFLFQKIRNEQTNLSYFVIFRIMHQIAIS